jgi:hypothetical protein
MTFSKQKPPFQILAPSNTSSGRTSSRRFFGSEIHFPNQTSSPIIDFFKPKANKSGHMLGLYVNLIVFLPYRFAWKSTKGHINTKCQYPLFTQPDQGTSSRAWTRTQYSSWYQHLWHSTCVSKSGSNIGGGCSWVP